MASGLRAFERINRSQMEEINSRLIDHAQKIIIHRQRHLEIIDLLKTSNFEEFQTKEFEQQIANAVVEMYSAGDTYRRLITGLRDSGMHEVINIAVPIVLKDYHPEKIPRKDIMVLQQAKFSKEDIKHVLEPALNSYIVKNFLRWTSHKGLFGILERAPQNLRLLATYYLANCIEAGLIFFGENLKGNPTKNPQRKTSKALKGIGILGRFICSIGAGILIGTDVASGASVASLLSIGGGLVAFGHAIKGIEDEVEEENESTYI